MKIVWGRLWKRAVRVVFLIKHEGIFYMVLFFNKGFSLNFFLPTFLLCLGLCFRILGRHNHSILSSMLFDTILDEILDLSMYILNICNRLYHVRVICY